jgi:hypothetical protein
MSNKKKEIIGLLENTIQNEKTKSGGGSSELIKELTKRLEKVKEFK